MVHRMVAKIEAIRAGYPATPPNVQQKRYLVESTDYIFVDYEDHNRSKVREKLTTA